jgi:hypothetical protein
MFAGPFPGSGSCGVLAEGDVEHPVQAVLDGPMAAHGLGEFARRHWSRRDVVAHRTDLLALFPCSRLYDGGKGGEAVLAGKAPLAVEPVDAGGDAGGAFLDAAMALVRFGRGDEGGLAGIVEEALDLAIRPG